MDTVSKMQEILDEHKEKLPDGAYVQMCSGLQELHPLNKLYTMTYVTFMAGEPDEQRLCVDKSTHTRIIRQGDDKFIARYDWQVEVWENIFRKWELPRNLPSSFTPFAYPPHGYTIVLSIEPYLKRKRDDDDA